MGRGHVELSVVVVGYNMRRELPRTLRSLSPAMQKGIDARQYEIILIDNGSPEPMGIEGFPAFGAQVVCHRIDNASPSPAAAVNFGLKRARGRIVGVMVDGARLASPGLLATALLAARLDARPVISSLGFHLGPDEQMATTRAGYDQACEDALLDEARWSEDGYRLFDIAALAGSSQGGFFLPIAESNALFLPASLWRELGGFDERFASPGGGYVNLDAYRRALDLPRTRLIVLLGEGTFHQVHGGAATSGDAAQRDAFVAEYARLRGKDFEPSMRDAILLGSAPMQAMRVFEQSARTALRWRLSQAPFRRLPPLFDTAWYLGRNPDVAAAGMDAGEHFLKFGQFEGRHWRR